MTSDAKKSLIDPSDAATDQAKPASAPKIDWDAVHARWEAQRAEARERLKVDRAALLEALREKGGEEGEAVYDGYAYSGNVQDIVVTPESVKLDDLKPRLRISSGAWPMISIPVSRSTMAGRARSPGM